MKPEIDLIHIRNEAKPATRESSSCFFIDFNSPKKRKVFTREILITGDT